MTDVIHEVKTKRKKKQIKKVSTSLELGPCTTEPRSQDTFTSVYGLQFPSTTTSVDIAPPRYSFIACVCTHMNELKNEFQMGIEPMNFRSLVGCFTLSHRNSYLFNDRSNLLLILVETYFRVNACLTHMPWHSSAIITKFNDLAHHMSSCGSECYLEHPTSERKGLTFLILLSRFESWASHYE